MAVGDVIQIRFFTHANQRQFINVFHYRETVEDTGPPNLAGINIAFGNTIAVGWDDFLSNESRVGCSIANQIVNVGPKRQPNTVYYVDAAGVGVSEAMPGNTAARVNIYGSNHGRPNRGALIISGLGEGSVVGNDLDPAFSALVQTNVIDNLIAGLNGAPPSTGEWEFGYMSRADVNPINPPVPWPGVFIKPTGYSISPAVQTLRSRQGTYTAVNSS